VFVGKTTWFNSALTCYFAWQDARNEIKRAVMFPNGDLMPEDAMNTLQQVAMTSLYNHLTLCSVILWFST
jgi:hypothetical protein